MSLSKAQRSPGESLRFTGVCLSGWLILFLFVGCSGEGEPGPTPEGGLEAGGESAGGIEMPGEAVVAEVMLEEENEGPSPSALMGAWQRPDGGYILQIREVRPDGSLDAAYFNPNPINVGKAKWRSAGAVLKVEVLLDDVNYQGSNYTLVYDAEKDLLGGVYYQAVARQSFQVYFVRRPESTPAR